MIIYRENATHSGNTLPITVESTTILTAMKTMGQNLALFTQALKEKLLQELVLNGDESGVRVKGALNWLHALSTTTLTWYGVRHHLDSGQAGPVDLAGPKGGYCRKSLDSRCEWIHQDDGNMCLLAS